MKTCVQCGYKNYEGTLVCNHCYKPLKPLTRDTVLVNPFQDVLDKSTFILSQNIESLTLMIQTEYGTRLVPFPHGHHFILGRGDLDTHIRPDIDLSIFGGRELGVSRQHAAIELTKDSLTLTDLESRNGTYLNRKQLTPYDINILRSGDEIRLGKLVMHILIE